MHVFERQSQFEADLLSAGFSLEAFTTADAATGPMLSIRTPSRGQHLTPTLTPTGAAACGFGRTHGTVSP
jgi:hypothetical protein